MEYHGIIYLDHELSFTQAKKMNDYWENGRLGLRITEDGKGIRWDGTRGITNLETTLANSISLLDKMKFNAVGIIRAYEKETKKYDIIIIKNMVKVSDGMAISTILPIGGKI